MSYFGNGEIVKAKIYGEFASYHDVDVVTLPPLTKDSVNIRFMRAGINLDEYAWIKYNDPMSWDRFCIINPQVMYPLDIEKHGRSVAEEK